MTGSIVVFGATGYTGHLVARELVARGASPVLAGRDRGRLEQLADQLSPHDGPSLEVRVADVTRPRSVLDILVQGDVLVATVGPFARWGHPAAVAAVARRATYLDSTGESRFIHEMRDRLDGPAVKAGSALIPAFGYDYVPGNLAGALALARAGEDVARVDIGYFAPGMTRLSGGTTASAAGIALTPSFRFVGGRLVEDRFGARTRAFRLDGRDACAASAGGSEHLFLPGVQPHLLEVGVYLGWFGEASRLLPAAAVVGRAAARIPGLRKGIGDLASRFGSSGGPDAEAQAATSSLVVAEASDATGAVLSRVVLTGPDPYVLTARLLAWGALTAAAGGVRGAGVLGPVQAFGLKELTSGCAELGLVEQAED